MVLMKTRWQALTAPRAIPLVTLRPVTIRSVTIQPRPVNKIATPMLNHQLPNGFIVQSG